MCAILAKFLLVLVLAGQVFSADYVVNKGDLHVKSKHEGYKYSFPYLVQIGYRSSFGLIWICSGTIIDSRKVITSSYCTNMTDYPMAVRLHDEDSQVEKFVTRGEVSVLFLKKRTDLVKNSACLSSNFNVNAAIAVGWGALSFDNQLHFTTNKEISSIKVNAFEIFEDTIKLRPTEGHLCVADKGGPLQVPSHKSGCLYDVVAILREWKDCGENGSFGAYIILANYIDWIKELKN